MNLYFKMRIQSTIVSIRSPLVFFLSSCQLFLQAKSYQSFVVLFSLSSINKSKSSYEFNSTVKHLLSNN